MGFSRANPKCGCFALDIWKDDAGDEIGSQLELQKVDGPLAGLGNQLVLTPPPCPHTDDATAVAITDPHRP